MVTAEKLSTSQSLPEPMIVTVSSVDWDVGKSRRAEVELSDQSGTLLELIDYEGANLATTWKTGHQYRITDCGVTSSTKKYTIALTPSKRTQVEPLGPLTDHTSILIVGDTHIGRTAHPKTGATIDPIEAFVKAIEYGLSQGVDAVVHVGDIFHETATTSQIQTIDVQVFEPLEDADIPFYFIRGNHHTEEGDKQLASRRLVSSLAENSIPVNSSIRIFGIDHDPAGDISLDSFCESNTINEPVSILVLHQTISHLSGSGEQHIELDELMSQSNCTFDYIMSGHHHDATTKQWEETSVMYTGATEAMSKNTDSVDRVAWLLTTTGALSDLERYDIP